MKKSKLFSDFVKCFESFHDINITDKIISYFSVYYRSMSLSMDVVPDPRRQSGSLANGRAVYPHTGKCPLTGSPTSGLEGTDLKSNPKVRCPY